MKKCRICGKEFDVLWPELWRYKKRNQRNVEVYFCSWSCLRKDEKGAERNMERNDQIQKARELAEAMERGADPIEWLREQGYGSPEKAYQNLRQKAKEKDQELFDRFPKRRQEKKLPGPEDLTEEDQKRFDDQQITPRTVDLVYDPEIAEEYRREQAQKKANEAAEKAALEEMLKAAEEDPDRRKMLWHTSAVWNEELGEFYYDRKYHTIDWRHPGGDEISIPVRDWAMLWDKIPNIMHVLGVDDRDE